MAMEQIVMNETSPLQAAIRPCSAPGDLPDGGVHVRITKFVLTSNTVTYALTGRAFLNTFEHYPYEHPDWASSPAWGVGVVTDSKCTGVPVGSRVHGYFPMAPWCTLYPSKVKRGGKFEDTAPHRQKLISAYRTYRIGPRLVPGKLDEEDLATADALLFTTGWGCAQEASALGATSIVLTSASSRTSLTAAFSAKFHKMFSEVIGVTSQRNVKFVQSTGLYDLVCAYEDIPSLGHCSERKVAVYDMAGNVPASVALRTHFGAQVVGWGSVGKTHVVADEGFVGAKVDRNGGARAKSFLVFQALKDAGKNIGPTMPRVLADAQEAFVKWKLPSFRSEYNYGAEATLRVWNATVANAVSPGVTYMCSLWPDPLAADPHMAAAKL